jgi:hypothetical protein
MKLFEAGNLSHQELYINWIVPFNAKDDNKNNTSDNKGNTSNQQDVEKSRP